MSYPQPPQGQPYGAPYGPPQQHPPKKRKLWPWILIGALILMCGGCFGVVAMGVDKADEAVDAALTSIASATAQAPAPGNATEAPAASPPPLTAAPPSGKGKQVKYEIISDATELNSVTYFDANSELQTESSASAPWSKTVTNQSTYAIVGLGAQTTGTSVTCRITVDGKVKDEKTSRGKFAVVNCSGTA